MVAREVIAVDDSTPFEVQLYPNPFDAVFYLKVNAMHQEEFTIQVYDMLGKLVESKSVAADAIESTEVGANFPSGIYHVIVTQGSAIKSLRIIKR